MKKNTLHFESLESRIPLSANTQFSIDEYANIGYHQIEYLDRGTQVYYQGSTKAFLSWRFLATDHSSIGFNVYKNNVRINSTTLYTTTNFTDNYVNTSIDNIYRIQPVINNIEGGEASSVVLLKNPTAQQYKSIQLKIPVGGTTPDGVSYTYTANDISVGDLDGDGEYEIVLKWDPTNSKDNSQSGYTGNVYIDAYKLSGSFLWRIDLGKNIRAGAHYTQFIVYDLDGDGKAEVCMKTAPGTIDGTGKAVLLGSDNVNADYRNSSGYILTGSEYLTVFDGLSGKNLVTTNYNPARGSVSSWGDSYGNRVDRFLAGVGYFDGNRPSLLMCRGYYTRTVLVAYDYRDGKLTQRWIFDTSSASSLSSYKGQGAHSLLIGDVDNDGKDEVVYGAMAVDHDGKPLWNSTYGHGDATHMSDMDLNNPGLEVFMVHETESVHKGNGGTLLDAATGKLLVSIPGVGDVGRGVALDIDPRYPGYELWTIQSALYDSKGNIIQDGRPSFVNMGIWWDGDLSRELLDGTTIADWKIDSAGNGYRQNIIYAPAGLTSNNSTKSTPCLVADLYGDWREEVIWRKGDNTELQIWGTTTATNYRLPTLMQDLQYRESIAWQNVAYNQPPNPSYWIGEGMTTPKLPNVYAIKYGEGLIAGLTQLQKNIDIKSAYILVSANGITESQINEMILNNKIYSSSNSVIGYNIKNNVVKIMSTIMGDTNLDGAVDITDILNIISNNDYDTNKFSSWEHGDFNHDGRLDILDIILLITEDFYDKT